MTDAIFIHIPKCAGTSIINALHQHGLEKYRLNPWIGDSTFLASKSVSEFNGSGLVTFCHDYLHELKANGVLTDSFYDRAFKFCFVRNPWDRFLSLYHYKNIYEKRRTRFKQFCMSFDRQKLKGQWNLQVSWIPDDIDYIGHVETIEQDFTYILSVLNLDHIQLKKDNTSKPIRFFKRHYTKYYDSESQEAIRDVYKEDIEKLGYEFGG